MLTDDVRWFFPGLTAASPGLYRNHADYHAPHGGYTANRQPWPGGIEPRNGIGPNLQGFEPHIRPTAYVSFHGKRSQSRSIADRRFGVN
jgi:hypothetical protein